MAAWLDGLSNTGKDGVGVARWNRRMKFLFSSPSSVSRPDDFLGEAVAQAIESALK
jgi:hypothetical protein